MSVSKLTIPQLVEQIRSAKGLRALWAFLAFFGTIAFFLGFWPAPLKPPLSDVPGLNVVFESARTLIPPWILALAGLGLAGVSSWRFVVVHAHTGALQARLQQLRLEQQKRLADV
jgi:hypothetical protein